MTQLLCNGVALDLYDDAGLQFSKKNAIFAFDELSAERTMSFKLPATPTNDRVLSLARIPAYEGTGMRARFDAVLIVGTVIKRGFLHVSKFDGKDYNAVLVCGYAYNLKEFGNRQLGQLILNQSVPQDVNANAPSPLVGYVKYHFDTEGAAPAWKRRPSVDIGQLLQEIDTQGVLPITGLTADVFRLIRSSEFQPYLDDVTEALINQNATQDDMGLSTIQGIVSVGQMVTWDGRDPDGVGPYTETTCFTCPQNMRITFPDNTPDNLCLCYPIYRSGDQYAEIGFYGTRKFVRALDGTISYTGEPLKGQTITLDDNNEKFMLLTADGLPTVIGVTRIDFDEFDFTYQPDYNIRVLLSIDELRSYDVGVSSLLMDLGIGDLLKMYSACTGLLIGVLKDGTIKFLSSLNPSYIEPSIIAIKDVERTFGDWAQENVTQFEESENVADTERLSFAYTIDNDNIAETKELLTLAAVEGNIYGDGSDNLVQVMGVVAPDYETPEDVLTYAGTHTYLERVALQKSALMQSICDKSTTIKVSARMSLLEFSDIDSETGFLVRGTQYTWTEISWQKDTAQMTLVRVK